MAMRRFFSSSTLVFLAILLFLVFWIGGGVITREPPAPAERAEVPVPTVAASISQAQDVRPTTVLFGNVVPNQTSVLRARVAGIVEEVVEQGHRAERGEQLALLSADDRSAGVARAEAELRSAERDHDAAQQLRQRGVTSEAELQTRFATLEAARANLRAAELALSNTRLTAPITGTVNDVMAEIGSFVDAGGQVLEIVNNDPLIAEIEVRQSEITSVSLGQMAQVEFQGGKTAEAQVTFIAPVATPQTRTFRVELTIPNPDQAIPAGLSAQIALSMQQQQAHMISPALIRLDDTGRIGVFTVDDDGETLRFQPVQVVQAKAQAIWVTGLADQARIVTISQGALIDGQKAQVEETPPQFRNILGRTVEPEQTP